MRELTVWPLPTRHRSEGGQMWGRKLRPIAESTVFAFWASYFWDNTLLRC